MAKSHGQKKTNDVQSTSKAQPAHEIRFGRIRCTLWPNKSADQGEWFNMTFSRSYRDGEGQWQTAMTFSRDDLLVVAALAQQAFLWIHHKMQGNGPRTDDESNSGRTDENES